MWSSIAIVCGAELRRDRTGGPEQVPAESHRLPFLGERHRGILERQREGGPRGFGPDCEVGLALEQAGDLSKDRLLLEDRSLDVRPPGHSDPLPR
jgi:hypothetical protein